MSCSRSAELGGNDILRGRRTPPLTISSFIESISQSGLLPTVKSRSRKTAGHCWRSCSLRAGLTHEIALVAEPEYDVELESLGNIDLLVRFANGQICPIEIKSWRNTRFRLRFDKALRQVQRQREALRAQNGVLWLPEAKVPNAGTRGDIVVVQGDERFLIECLRKLSYRFVVRFPQAPSQVLCAQLRELQLYWNQRDECWEGRGPSPGSIPFGRKSRPRAGP